MTMEQSSLQIYSVGNAIKFIRDKAGLYQNTVAAMAEISTTKLCRAELDIQPISTKEMLQVARAMEIDPWQISDQWSIHLRSLDDTQIKKLLNAP